MDTSILDSIDQDSDLPSASKQARFVNNLVSEEKHKRGISNDLIAVLTCVDRNKSNITLPGCLGRISTKHIADALGDSFADDAILVTDSHSAYRGYAKDNGIHLEQVPSGQHRKGAFNLARVNSYHSRLSGLNHHHKVVASKYCTGYFAQYQWQDKHRTETTKDKKSKFSTWPVVRSNCSNENIMVVDCWHLTQKELSLFQFIGGMYYEKNGCNYLNIGRTSHISCLQQSTSARGR